MDQKINQIIDELISLDPEFEKHRPELERLLANILASKPEPVIDQQFVINLRTKIMEEENKPKVSVMETIRNSFMKKLVFSGVGVVVIVLIIAAGLVYIKKPNNNSVITQNTKVQVIRTSDHAFGSLATLTASSATGKGGGGGDASAPMGFGMGGGGGGVGSPNIMPYEPVNYKYVYKGDPLTLDKDKLDVLKKDPINFSQSLDLSSFGLGLINLSSFPGAKVQSINLGQGSDGYSIYVDLMNGNISVNGYFGPIYDAKTCNPNGCPQPPALNPSDVPDDQTMISIANDFVNAHGVPLTNYATPEVVQNLYGVNNKMMPISEIQQVVYPFKVDNNVIYDESGNKSGLVIGIDIRNKKVSSIWNLVSSNFQASSYDAETDPAKILKIAEQGGMYYYGGDPNAKKTVEIDLGTPMMQYVFMWDYSNGTSNQILVPSLIFPVITQPSTGNFYRNAVTVPLIKEILSRDNGGVIKPMQGSSSSGTVPEGTVVPSPVQ